MADSEFSTSTRRGFISSAAKNYAYPLALVLAGSYAAYYFAVRAQMRHDLSLSIGQSDNGTDPVTQGDILGNLGGLGPPPSITPGTPATEFQYLTLIQNNGDYPEENVVAQIWFDREDASAMPTSLNLDASSRLLFQTITAGAIDKDMRLSLTIPLLTPGEWVLVTSVWPSAVHVVVETRSEDVARTKET